MRRRCVITCPVSTCTTTTVQARAVATSLASSVAGIHIARGIATDIFRRTVSQEAIANSGVTAIAATIEMSGLITIDAINATAATRLGPAVHGEILTLTRSTIPGAAATARHVTTIDVVPGRPIIVRPGHRTQINPAVTAGVVDQHSHRPVTAMHATPTTDANQGCAIRPDRTAR